MNKSLKLNTHLITINRNTKLDLSMVPLILPEDKVLIIKSNKFFVDDIIAFEQEGKLIAHRLIYLSKDGAYLINKGDNNHKADQKISKNKILGKIETIKRGEKEINLSHVYLSQSINYLNELNQLDKHFMKEKIPYIVLKGLPLHIFINNLPPKRIYYDIDILIKSSDFQRTAITLKKLGFRKVTSKLFGKAVKKPTQFTFIKSIKPFPVIIDLHLEVAVGFTKIPPLNQLLPESKKLTTLFFKNIKKVKINSHFYPILSESELLFFLFLHLFHHNFREAHRYQIINDLIKNKKINWDKVALYIKKHNFEGLTYPALIFLKKYYRTPVPQSLVKKIEPDIALKIIAKIVAFIIYPFNSLAKNLERVERFFLVFLLSPVKPKKKLRIVVRGETLNYAFLIIKSFVLNPDKIHLSLFLLYLFLSGIYQ